MKSYLVNVAFASLLAIICWSRMGTLATGEDPATYISLARGLLDSGFGRDGAGAVLQFIAPIFPLWIALILGVSNAAVVYWVQPVLWALVMALTARWATEYLRETRPGAELWMGILGPLLLLSGNDLNAHFMLLPFREIMALGFAVLSLWLWRRAVLRSSGGHGLWSGVLLLLAVGVRENMLLAFAGVITIAGTGVVFRRESPRPLFGLLSPLLGLLVMVVILYGLGVWAPNLQMRSWWAYLAGENGGSRFETRLALSASWIVPSLGVVGSLGLVWSLWRQRWNSLFWGSFILPAVLFLLFHAGFIPHKRYFLITLFFFAPAAAWGLFDALQGALRWVRRPSWARWISRAAWTAVIAWALGVAYHVGSWGARVSWSDVRQLRQTMCALPHNAVVLDETARRAREAFQNYTSNQIITPFDASKELGKGRPVFYLSPLNKDAVHTQKTLYADARTIGAYYSDVRAASTNQILLAMGSALFELVEWRSKSLECVENTLALTGPAKVLWIDFGHRSPCSREVETVVSCDDRIVWTGSLYASGWQPVALPHDRVVEARNLQIKCRDPEKQLPSSLPICVQDEHRSLPFSMVDRRSLSTDRWVEGIESPRPYTKWAATFDRDLALNIPVPAGAPVQTWKCVFFLMRRSPDPEDVDSNAGEPFVTVSSPWMDATVNVPWPQGRRTITIPVAGRIPSPMSPDVRALNLHVHTSRPMNIALTGIRVGYDLTPREGSPEAK